MEKAKFEEKFKKDVEEAKQYLQKKSTVSNLNIYDHLSEVLTAILDEKPNNSVDLFENLWQEKSKSKVAAEPAVVEEEDPKNLQHAQTQRKLFDRDLDAEGMEPEPEDDGESPLPNIMDLAFYFEQAGVGLSREETYRIFLALKELVDNHPLQSVKFWGKIYGVESNYYIAEVEYREGEEEEEEEEEEQGEGEEESKEERDDDDDEPQEEDDTPKPDWKPPPPIPKEDKGTGCNKKTYFVTTSPGMPWIKLPVVTPGQITIARQIKKFFTGKLDALIISYPPFPGLEINYLRAQIARITAATHVSPAGFYMFEEEEEEEEEAEARDTYMTNVDYEGMGVRELTDPTLHNWVHHEQHILPQGRCTWHNPIQKPEEDFEDEEELEEEGDEDKPIPETGPPLLTSVGDDEDVGGMPAWTPYISSNLLPFYAVAVMRSNRWPGGYAFSKDKKFENIYVGTGHKYYPENYSPPAPPPVLSEYIMTADICEMDDPTVEEEHALKKAQEALEEEQLEEGEEEDDDDD